MIPPQPPVEAYRNATAVLAHKGSLRRAVRALARCVRPRPQQNRDGRLRRDHSGGLSTLRNWGSFYFALTQGKFAGAQAAMLSATHGDFRES